MAGDTDGVDGLEEIAGALLALDTLARARASGIHPIAALENNDGHGERRDFGDRAWQWPWRTQCGVPACFGALGYSVVTGPTLTNVNDSRAVLVVGADAT
ncbi:hypothetical protein F7R26_038255 (plasmid) [Cupriavidus basilensis]|uniref:MOFRL domain-containing protein n=1 Tax=Cupriavidus basilensis TaxID=68895 RepID=A0A643FZ84_9BURK|nr:hypothetical protein F7R26_038255 [Cupriavidus basilensis]